MGIPSVGIQFTIYDQLSQGVKKIRGHMQALAKENKGLQDSYNGLARSAKYAVGIGLLTRQMARGLAPAVSYAGDLQAELLGVRAELAGAGKSAMDLEKDLKRISATGFDVQAWSPYNQSQMVALQKDLIKAGARVVDVIGKQGAAAASAALATYENLDPVLMGKSLIGIATPFKIQADQFMNLADQISRASSASTVGAAEITETAKYAAPAMSLLGRSTEEMLAMSAMMAQMGIDSSMAGVGMRQFFTAASGIKKFQDSAGNLKPTAEIIGILQDKLKGLGEAEKLDLLTRAFGDRGAAVAMALMETGANSLDDMKKKMGEALPLADKIKVTLAGWKKQTEALRGTATSTIASLFQPALAPLTTIVTKMNEFVTLIGKAAQDGGKLAEIISGISLGGVVVGGAATAGLTGAAGYFAFKTLKQMGGVKGLMTSLGSTAAGIGTGKLVQEATGVTPVFVTNWPAGGSLSNPGTPIPKGAGMLKSVVGVTAAGAAGYGAGWLMNQGAGMLSDKMSGGKYKGEGWLGEMVYDWIHQEPVNDITLNINIDENGRVETITDGMSTRTDINVRRGHFFEVPQQ